MSRRPNLLVIMADQFRATSLGVEGVDPVRTPNLDALAAAGVRVRRAFSNYPVCSPDRAMFLTGLTPHRNGVTHNTNSQTAAWGVALRDGVQTWSTVLKDVGYATGYIGKWHLEAPNADDVALGEGVREDGKVWDAYSSPTRRFGFDFWHSYGAADRHLSPHYWVGDAPREARLDVDRWSVEHEVDVAIDFITQTPDDTPFALMLSINPPHQPFDQIPEHYRHRVDHLTDDELLTLPNVPSDPALRAEAAAIARDYFCAVQAVDDQLGRLLRHVADTCGDDTLIVFTSDHGMQLGSHGEIYKNVPFDESMRIPLTLTFPGRLAPSVTDQLIATLDIAPTLLSLLGLSDRIPADLAGHDRSDVLLHAHPQDDHAAWYYRYPLENTSPSDLRGIRTHEGKLIATYENGQLRTDFTDLAADPYELNRSKTGGEELAARLVAHLRADEDPWPGTDALAERAKL